MEKKATSTEMETKNHKKDDRVKPVEDKEIIEQL
jgi:hypothetical protein